MLHQLAKFIYFKIMGWKFNGTFPLPISAHIFRSVIYILFCKFFLLLESVGTLLRSMFGSTYLLFRINAHYVIRVATDRHWVTDVRDQKFWLEDADKKHRFAVLTPAHYSVLPMKSFSAVITSCTGERASSTVCAIEGNGSSDLKTWAQCWQSKS